MFKVLCRFSEADRKMIDQSRTLITDRGYTLAHIEGELYKCVKLGSLDIVPDRQRVIRVDGQGKAYDTEQGHRIYMIGRGFNPLSFSQRAGY